MPQSLWTHARENLDILTLVFANRSYQILRDEMQNVGATISAPSPRPCSTSATRTSTGCRSRRAFGVEAFRAATADELSRHIDAGLALQGPAVIEVTL